MFFTWAGSLSQVGLTGISSGPMLFNIMDDGTESTLAKSGHANKLSCEVNISEGRAISQRPGQAGRMG